MMTAKEILQALKDRYPDPEDDQVSIQFSGYVHEHPMTAIEVVLISSIVLGTTEVNKLSEFTGYSKRFILTGTWRITGFGKTASISVQAGLLATFYLVISTKRANFSITFQSRREHAGHKMQSPLTVWIPARFFGMKNA